MKLNAIDSRFELDQEPSCLAGVETPVPVINLDVVEANLRRWQRRCDRLGLANRPHVKTHKITALAQHQLALGASGITVQKLGEAEIMAEAGVPDILVTFNIVGRAKLVRLAALAETTRISVVADHPAVVEGLEKAAADGGGSITVLVECDTGAGRNGVQSPREAATLAASIRNSPHLSYGGLMTFPKPGGRRKMGEFLTEAIRQADLAGCPTDCVSVGGTPDMWSDEGLETATEYRAGTYIFNDLSVMAAGACTADDCAVDVLATVVSLPTPDRAILDAGSKALTSDQLGEEGFGRLRGSEAKLRALSEEHGILDTRRMDRQPNIGDLVRIIPNHVCPVINLFDRVALMKDGAIIGSAMVDARGRVA